MAIHFSCQNHQPYVTSKRLLACEYILAFCTAKVGYIIIKISGTKTNKKYKMNSLSQLRETKGFHMNIKMNLGKNQIWLKNQKTITFKLFSKRKKNTYFESQRNFLKTILIISSSHLANSFQTSHLVVVS